MKQFGTILISSIIAICFSLSATAQSSDKVLDQQELIIQFSGKWSSVIGKDTTVYYEVTPFGKGFVAKGDYQAKGETYTRFSQLIGFGPENQKVLFYSMLGNGQMTWYMGKFVSEKKLIFENLDITQRGVVRAIGEVLFLSPDKFKFTSTWRGGEEISWDNAEVSESIYTKVKQ